jgi:hypothetical protein
MRVLTQAILLVDALGDPESAFREAVRLTIEVMKFLIEAMRLQLERFSDSSEA